jgi:hypothetical protein
MFNLLILGVGLVIASFWFVAVKESYTIDGVTDYGKVFMVPTALAIGAMILLLFFKPPSQRPNAT